MIEFMPLIYTDSYKLDHRSQYPEGTELVYSNFTPRGSRIPGVNKVTFFGLQYYIKDYLIRQWNDNFFNQPKKDVLEKYNEAMSDFVQRKISSKHVEDLHDLGYLPIKICAVPEGTKVPLRVPIYTIHNTVPEFFWLTNFLETSMSNVLWEPCTSATIAGEYRRVFNEYSDETVGNSDFVQWQGHDFSYRGLSGLESTCLSGSGHLLYFTGTDTVPAVYFLKKYYNASGLIGSSVVATEHSTQTLSILANGHDLLNGEFEQFRRLITEVYPDGIVSIVCDSYDYWRVITEILPKLKNEILSRNGKVVVRPDCYDSETKILTNSGWKFFKDLLDDDLVAQVNIETNEQTFVKPLKIIKQAYKGRMIHFKDGKGKVDLLVTPNHRMVVKSCGKDVFIEADKLKLHYKKSFIRTAKTVNRNISISNIDRLRIAFQADGSYVTSSKNSIRFSFSKERKINRMKKLCDNIGLEYKIYNLSDNRKEFNIKINDISLFTKDFTWINTSDLCSNWCREFIDELSNWDSSIRSSNRIKFDTTTKSVSDVVELIAISAGYGVLTSSYEDNRKDIYNTVYTSNILLNNIIGGQAIDKTEEEYDGYVYCVTVPNGAIIVKRNRSIIVSGNSGDPVKIVCGDKDAQLGSPEYYGSVEMMHKIFGGSFTRKGYKSLDDHIGIIYGDSITMERQKLILEGLKRKGFASNIPVLGIGSFTYRYTTRDTFGFAVKTTYGRVNGKSINIFKDPKTDDGLKRSAKGLLGVRKTNNGLELVEELSEDEYNNSFTWNVHQPVFENGKLLKDFSLQEIRDNAAKEF